MSASTSGIAPNSTLYVKNIPSKIKKAESRRQLYCLFNAYGKVIDVVATRQDGMRGQAFVVFRDLASATSALRALDGFDFYGSALSLDYARSKSKATVIDQHGPEALFDPNVMASTRGGDKQKKITLSSAGADLRGRERKRAREEAGNNGTAGDKDTLEEEEEEEEEEEKEGESKGKRKVKGEEENEDEDGERGGKRRKSEGTAIANGATNDDDEEEMQMGDSDEEEQDGGETLQEAELGPPLPAAGTVPNNLLFCNDLPSEVTDDMLGVLFQQYPGFRAAQLLPSRPGRTPPGAYAFVEFESTEQAGVAVEALNEFKLAPGKSLHVNWAARGKI